jgi:uncharacterized membrane protein HdeD (DUF308 family)
VLLGGLIFTGWPGSALWLIGLFVGAEILLQGITLTMLPTATSAKRGAQPWKSDEDIDERRAA